jgi:nucleoside-diphosphate-sugar epimerase
MELVKSAMEGKDIIFHLAACPFIPSCYNYPSEFIDVNIRGTLNVLLSAKELRPEKIVKISTGEVYGVPVYLPIDDKHPTNPISTYAVSKLSAERLCHTFCLEHGLSVNILRLFNVYGPRDTHPRIIPEIISQLSKQDKIYLGNTNASRDFTFVEDTTRAIVLAGLHDEWSGAINIGSGKSYNANYLIETVSSIMKVDKPEVICDESKCRPADIEKLQVDTTKSREVLGWESKIPLKEGITKTINWYNNHAKKEWPWEKRKRAR